MTLHKPLATALVAVAASFGMATNAMADDHWWNWNYSGGGVSASGTFETAGDASTPEAVLAITGTYSDSFVTGAAITGLVPTSDPEQNTVWIFDNLLSAASPFVSTPGILFAVNGLASHVNIYDNGGYISGTHINGSFQLTSVNFNVAAVPEPETYALMLAGLGAVAFIARRRQRQS